MATNNVRALVWVLALLVTTSAVAQQPKKYLITFRDKANSPYSVGKPEAFLSARSIERRQRQSIPVAERDLPPNPTYVQGLRQTGATVWYTSRWLNAALVEASSDQLAQIQKLGYVTGLESNTALNFFRNERTVNGTKSIEKQEFKKRPDGYGFSAPQVTLIGADSMHARGYHGEGMLIGVLDNGFINVDKIPLFRPLFAENRIVATYDFVNRKTNVYDRGSHGTMVLSTMASYSEDSLIGTAYKASYALIHTEDDTGERLQEEAFWLFGAEYADSLGVDVINSSLGYTVFDDAATSHTYQDLNGRTTIITRAAEWAAAAGIVVVVAAGNEGSKSWKYISAPADATSIIAVGATDRTGQPASFSSYGPSVDGRVKPDLAAMGSSVIVANAAGRLGAGSGTSFASPILAGMVAGFWQAFPYLTASQVIEALKKSASQYNNPDTRIGYGIPNFVRASDWVNLNIGGGLKLSPNPSAQGQVLRLELPVEFSTEAIDARLTDLRGTQVWAGTLRGPVVLLPFNTTILPAGQYVLRLQNRKGAFATKVIRL